MDHESENESPRVNLDSNLNRESRITPRNEACVGYEQGTGLRGLNDHEGRWRNDETEREKARKKQMHTRRVGQNAWLSREPPWEDHLATGSWLKTPFVFFLLHLFFSFSQMSLVSSRCVIIRAPRDLTMSKQRAKHCETGSSRKNEGFRWHTPINWIVVSRENALVGRFSRACTVKSQRKKTRAGERKKKKRWRVATR